jgi:uncharacterized protein YkwD
MRPIRLPLIALCSCFTLALTACGDNATGPFVHTDAGATGSTGPTGNGNGGGGSSGGGTSAPSAATNPMVLLTNQARAANGLKPLAENALLDQAAAILCDEVAQTGLWEHVQTGSQYPTVGERADAVGYHWVGIAENLAGTTGLSTEQIFAGWMASPGHHANIMLTTVTEIGVASKPVGTRICSVQVFASR